MAVAFGAPHPPLVLYRFSNGRLSAPVTPVIPGFGSATHPDDELISAEFHPGRNIMALVYFKNPRFSLLEVKSESGGDAVLAPWGNDVEIDRKTFLARFTADGRFVLTNSMLTESEALSPASNSLPPMAGFPKLRFR